MMYHRCQYAIDNSAGSLRMVTFGAMLGMRIIANHANDRFQYAIDNSAGSLRTVTFGAMPGMRIIANDVSSLPIRH